MALLSQRGKEMYHDEYNFIYTLKGKNKDGSKLYWTCARKKTCGFQSSLQCSHPTLWKLLDQLIRENELHRLTVVQLMAGQTYKPKRVYRITNERIVNVVADYNNRTTVEFLRVIAHNLQL